LHENPFSPNNRFLKSNAQFICIIPISQHDLQSIYFTALHYTLETAILSLFAKPTHFRSPLLLIALRIFVLSHVVTIASRLD